MSVSAKVKHPPLPSQHLLPEEDAIDDPDEDDEADPTVPGDLWYRQLAAAQESGWKRRRILAGGQAIRR